MSDPARRIATYQDVLDAPPHVIAEVIIRAATGDSPVRLEPFDAIELELAALWAR